jgi:hypothetical protein
MFSRMNEALKPSRRGNIRRKLGFGVGILILLALVATTISAFVNFFVPTHSQIVDRLNSQEKALLGEALQLKRSVGDSIWPGFGQKEIPLVIWNEQQSFLLGDMTVPGWERVPGDTFFGHPYYRGHMQKDQAFTVTIGDRWAGSMATREWMQIKFAKEIRDKLPCPLRPVFPYPLAIRLLGMRSSEQYISVILHEVFHAYQAEAAPARFARAQQASASEPTYPWDNPDLRRAWTSELQLLVRALNAKSNKDTTAFVAQFVAQRRQRRQQSAMNAAVVDYERQVEWLEGLAKYVELSTWREGSIAQRKGYEPMAELYADPEFKNYMTFSKRWSGEISTLKWQASQRGDTRFYYSGMAQAFLLDRLMPEWKARVPLGAVVMDDLLAECVGCSRQGFISVGRVANICAR